MRAVQITRFGGPEVLHVVDLPDPTPSEGPDGRKVPTLGLPALAYVVGEGRVLPYREDLLEGQVVTHRQGAHHDLVELIVRLDLHDADDPALPGDLVQALDDPGLQRAERRLRLTLPLVPELVAVRSEEHTSELQSRQYLVCRLLLEKKQNPTIHAN